MKETAVTPYVKRTQKDYPLSFKLQVVGEVERGELTIGGSARKYGIQNPSTVTNWLRKFGTFDWQTQTPSVMKRTPEQTIFELQQKVKLLEKQKHLLEHELEFQSQKAIFFDMMIDLAEQDMNIKIRKKCFPEPSTATGTSAKSQ